MMTKIFRVILLAETQTTNFWDEPGTTYDIVTATTHNTAKMIQLKVGGGEKTMQSYTPDTY